MSKRQRDRHKEIRQFRKWEREVFGDEPPGGLQPLTLSDTDKELVLRRNRDQWEVIAAFGIPPELLH